MTRLVAVSYRIKKPLPGKHILEESDIMSEKLDRYNPEYPYIKESIDTGLSAEGYPIIERTSNGLLYPEAPKNLVDMNDVEDSDLT